MNKREIVLALKAMDLDYLGARFELNEHLDNIGKIYRVSSFGIQKQA